MTGWLSFQWWRGTPQPYCRVNDIESGLLASAQVNDADELSSSLQLSSVLVTGNDAAAVTAAGGEERVLPPDVYGRASLSFLSVAELLRARAVSKAYGTELIDAAFIMQRIDSYLAQQDLTGLIDVERHRTDIDYFSRCAYLIEQANRASTLIRMANSCRLIDNQLPLVLPAECVLADLPDKTTFHRLPTTMAVYKTVGQLFGGDSERGENNTAAVGLRIEESERLRVETFPEMDSPLWILGLYCPVVWTFVWWICVCMCIRVCDSAFGDYIKAMEDTWYLDCLLVILQMIFAAVATLGLVGPFFCFIELLTARWRVVQWCSIGGRRFRAAFRDELPNADDLRIPPQANHITDGQSYRATYWDRDPAVLCGASTHPSFTTFALHTLIMATKRRVLLDMRLEHQAFQQLTRHGITADEHDVILIEWRDDRPLRATAKDCERIMIVLLMEDDKVGGPAVASLKLRGNRRLVLKTNEREVMGGWTLDERFPLTMSRMRQLLKRFELEDTVLGPT
ncbi:unnamed protein product [Vitrella brassicaformis CCMP3155]|uniref:Uncharacterized protein n=3 Tax=Vitrella brassicaformis TaxID=1169539 RepID=A0A0G4GEF5_VITBC|nr:unnamed protein product [Vitrella brassicaformis CCMP3155]|eukprot:CEM27752.1 unnamed protein product [Vitrella brassicaformis CCMP3155]